MIFFRSSTATKCFRARTTCASTSRATRANRGRAPNCPAPCRRATKSSRAAPSSRWLLPSFSTEFSIPGHLCSPPPPVTGYRVFALPSFTGFSCLYSFGSRFFEFLPSLGVVFVGLRAFLIGPCRSGAPERAHGQSAVRVRPLREDVPLQRGAEEAPARPQRRAALHLHRGPTFGHAHRFLFSFCFFILSNPIQYLVCT